MTGRERVNLALSHCPADRVPRELWALPGVFRDRADEVRAIQERFPSDFATPRYRYGRGLRARGDHAQVGTYVDAWGCPWQVLQRGLIGEVKDPPLSDWGALNRYQPPWELLDQADLSQVNASCRQSEAFVRPGTETRPFERTQFLRGTEDTLIDIAYGTSQLRRLLEMLHEFFCREMRMWAATEVDGVQFMDDWGTQQALLIDPAAWRGLFKPLYRDYCDILHQAGKRVFFHSDGHIQAILPDLIEIGIDAVNSQLFCMDIEQIGREFAGKITFWGEIDRQHILPFGTPADVRAAVRRVRAALDRGRGGVIAQCEWGLDVPAENIAACFEAWDEPLTE